MTIDYLDMKCALNDIATALGADDIDLAKKLTLRAERLLLAAAEQGKLAELRVAA